MTDQPTVLVITRQLDPTADLVVTELAARAARVVRCDIADFPQKIQIAATFDGTWGGEIVGTDWRVDLTALTGAYYRRPTHPKPSTALDDTDSRWAATEALAGFGGLLASMDIWLNHPHRIGYAEFKPVQLATAAQCGLRTPATLITNVPTAARAFTSRPTVYKAFSSAHDDQSFIYAQRLTEPPDDRVAHTAHLFQHWVDKAWDARVTVVDGHLFGVRIDAGSEASRTDWRADYESLSYQTVSVPNGVGDGVRRMLSTLGLRFAAIDFAVTAAGDWVFLDLNPNGQWAWLQHHTGVPIASAIAEALIAVHR